MFTKVRPGFPATPRGGLRWAADFNLDGAPDLIWQNSSTRQVVVWYMGGPQRNIYQGSNWLAASVPGWTVVGAADFNQDGILDLVWENYTTQQTVIWYMSGSQGNIFSGTAWINGTGSPGWTAVVRLTRVAAPRLPKLLF
jgi:hypothetical protein